VYASSSSVYGDALTLPTPEDVTPRPLSPYGVTKLAAEHLCVLYAEEQDVSTVALRYFSVYGPRQRPDMAFRRFCAAIVNGDPIEVFGDGCQSRDFTFVGDIVSANVLAGTADTAPGQVFNVSGGSSVDMLEVISTIEAELGESVPIEQIGDQPGDVARTGGDSTKAASLLGWRPEVSLREGIRRQIAHERTVGVLGAVAGRA
jgi:nucleoside-diphosphate-sugar epimerase